MSNDPILNAIMKKHPRGQVRVYDETGKRIAGTNRDYYGGDDPYEAIKVIRAWGLNFALGSVLKYIKRHGNKPGTDPIDCLTKARDYLDDEINALRAANTPDRPTTTEPETSPAKPGSRHAQDGLRVGARVRISEKAPYRAGAVGIIDGSAGEDPLYDWIVKFDHRTVAYYKASELEVIE